jgi:hypothetical protein
MSGSAGGVWRPRPEEALRQFQAIKSLGRARYQAGCAGTLLVEATAVPDYVRANVRDWRRQNAAFMHAK